MKKTDFKNLEHLWNSSFYERRSQPSSQPPPKELELNETVKKPQTGFRHLQNIAQCTKTTFD